MMWLKQKKGVTNMKKFIIALSMLLVLAGCGGSAEKDEGKGNAENKVMMYSSLKEEQLSALKEGFNEKYPDIEMDYYAAGTSKIATKMATEQQSGQIAADVIWVGDPSHYITFKEKGILEPYESEELAHIDDRFKDSENYYVGARLVSMGFVYNTNSVEGDAIPTKWNDLLDEEFRDQLVMTDPGESGTIFYLVSALMNEDKYGLDYFQALKDMGMELESGTTATTTKVATNAYKVGIGVDYVTETLEKEGSQIKFSYPEEDLVSIISPIGLIKDSPNPDNGKLLYDFIISKEGQEILAETGVTPVRNDVQKEGGLSAKEIADRSMVIDNEMVAKNSSEILEKFDKIFK